MDGNGRWAKERLRPRAFGHQRGAKAARTVARSASDAGVEILTLFAFSQENWHRPEDEVSLLMYLFVKTLKREIRLLTQNNVRWRFIGDRAAFSPQLRELMVEAERKSAHCTGLLLQVAVGYGGHWDITQAAAATVRDGVALTQEALEARLATAGQPPVDLMIRTGGESRISNFMLWQLAYAELYFCNTLWPDFDGSGLREAIEWFAGRQRRFGRVPEAA